MRTVFWCSVAASAALFVAGVSGWYACLYHPESPAGRVAAFAGRLSLPVGPTCLPAGAVKSTGFWAAYTGAVALRDRMADAVIRGQYGIPEEAQVVPAEPEPAPVLAQATVPMPMPPEVIDLSTAADLPAPPHMPQSDEPPLAPEVVPVEHAAEPCELPGAIVPASKVTVSPPETLGVMPMAEEESEQSSAGCADCVICRTLKVAGRMGWAWAVRAWACGHEAVAAARDAVVPCKHEAPVQVEVELVPAPTEEPAEVPECRETPDCQRYYPGCPYTGHLHHPYLHPTEGSSEESSEDGTGPTGPCHPEVDTTEYRPSDGGFGGPMLPQPY